MTMEERKIKARGIAEQYFNEANGGSRMRVKRIQERLHLVHALPLRLKCTRH